MEISLEVIIGYVLNFSEKNLFLIMLLLILLQIFSAVLILPCGYISILCGVLLGWKLGFLVSITASSLSVATTFYIGTFFSNNSYFNKIKESKLFKIIPINKKFKIDSSWKNILLYFINPLVPGSSMGYLFGLNKCDQFLFNYRALLLSIPGCILSSSFGAGIMQEYFFGGANLTLKIIIILFIISIIIPKIYSFNKKHVRENNDQN